MRRFVRAAALIGAALAGLAACTGGPAEPSATPPPTQAPQPCAADRYAGDHRADADGHPATVRLRSGAHADRGRPDTRSDRCHAEARAAQALGGRRGRKRPARRPIDVIAATGVRAGRVIDGCGRAVSGQSLVSVLDGEDVIEVLVGPEDAQVCGTVNLYDDRPDLFIQRDPIAEGLVLIARTRAARAAEVEEADVVLVSARPVNWPDATLGCTADGAPAPTPETAFAGVAGYRIVVEADGDPYIYHTDFDRIIPCVEP
ncbi:MAG: hypothetical protein HND48_22730 [Chloroflexi bacterium]|nr:hypothetical protein [Chloroflexota bacterium]